MVHEEFSAMRIIHPNICHSYHMWNKEATVYMVMEFCGGGSLTNLIYEGMHAINDTGSNPLSAVSVLRYVMQNLLSALIACERRRLVHADFKPGNILLSDQCAFRTREEDMREDNIFVTSDGSPIVLKLTDFGFSRAKLHSTGSVLIMRGTYGYRAPEVIEGKKADMKADVYSLGITLYEIAMLHLPWENPSDEVSIIKQLRRDGNVTVDEIGFPGETEQHRVIRGLMNRMLENDPKRRPSASELQTAMRDAGLWT